VEYLTTIDRDRIATLLQRDEYFWLDLESPEDADVEQLGELLGLHRLAIEDSVQFDQRPKVEDYGRQVLVVFYGVAPFTDGDPKLAEVHIYVGGSNVVTLHRSPCEEFDQLREHLQQRADGPEQFVVYKIFDALTDSFVEPLNRTGTEIERLEDAVTGRPTPAYRERLLTLGRSLVRLRGVVSPQRDILARQMDQVTALPGLETGNRDYFRDVYDHLMRHYEEIESQRERLAAATQLYVSSVSNRLNEVMERLTVIATIFLPLTVITGFFGQNFGWLVGHIDTQADFLIYGVGGIALPVILMLTVFRARGWI
jgi:magnesium transporter